jgi:hypothetical protein
MNTIDKKQRAHQTRMTWRKKQAERRSARRREADTSNTLQPLQFEPGDIVDTNDGTIDGRILAAGDGLTVLVPAYEKLPEVEGDVDVITLLWAPAAAREEGDGEFEPASEGHEVHGPVSDADYPRVLTLDPTYLRPDGPFRLAYRVRSYNDSTTWAAPITLIADSTPPWRNLEPPKIIIPDVPIDDEYLAGNTDGVKCTLPEYVEWQAGDQVTFWWAKEPLPDNPADLPHAGQVAVGQVPMEVVVPADVVQSTGDGGCYLLYMLTDKANNRSRLSVYSRVAVALGPKPTDLQPLFVPLAEVDGEVDLMDAYTGVDACVPTYFNWKPTDRIRVTWGTRVLAEEPVGSAPDTFIPIRVPTQVLRDEYGAATGPVDTTVSYQVLRGDVAFAGVDTIVKVDLSVIGPELPEWPDPVNPQLVPPTVFGAASNIANELNAADFDQPARMEFELYDPCLPGEIVQAYWNGVLITEEQYVVVEGDMPGDVHNIAIPWRYIEAAGNQPNLPVHYRISVPGSPNEQHSKDTLVTAKAVVHTPPAPSFLRVSSGGWLNCDSLDPDDHWIDVQVPDVSKYAAAGDKITLTWKPFWHRVDQVLLEDAILVEEVELDAAMVTGFVWHITPYATHILPIYDADDSNHDGVGRVHYTLQFEGETITSLEVQAWVGMWDSAGSCDVTLAD